MPSVLGCFHKDNNMTKKTDKTEKKQRKRGAPKEYLFKPGQSGNPKGRPPGVKNFSTIFEEALKKIAKATKTKEAQVEIDLVIKAIAKARGGDYKFYKDIFDRVYGLPKQKMEIGGEGGLPFTIKVVKDEGSTETQGEGS